MRLKPPNSATSPESAFCICSAISAGIRCAWCGAAPIVTGLDFSSAALDVARRLSDETGLKANFVEGTVDQAPELTPGPFDLVFTTWGTICWLPDMKQWAKTIASVLAPGGELYFADAHPAFTVLEEVAGKLVPTYDFQTPAERPLQFANETTYTGDPTIMSHQSTREWIHSLSAVLGGLIDAGLDDHDVQGTRGLAVAGSAKPGAGVGQDVAAAGWRAAHSLVLFVAGKEDAQ